MMIETLFLLLVFGAALCTIMGMVILLDEYTRFCSRQRWITRRLNEGPGR